MKPTIIKGIINTRQVYIDNEELLPDASQKVKNHSPDGFAWGYGGSGPSQLALAILMRFIPTAVAFKLYQDFKFEYIAKLNMNDDFILNVDVHAWIEEKIKKIKLNTHTDF